MVCRLRASGKLKDKTRGWGATSGAAGASCCRQAAGLHVVVAITIVLDDAIRCPRPLFSVHMCNACTVAEVGLVVSMADSRPCRRLRIEDTISWVPHRFRRHHRTRCRR